MADTEDIPSLRVNISNQDDAVSIFSAKGDGSKIEQDNSRIGNRPAGLWYAFDTQWKQFLEHNPELSRKAHPNDHVLELDEKKLLVLDTPEAAQKFIDTYGEKLDPNNPESYTFIHWKKVAEALTPEGERIAGVELGFTPSDIQGPVSQVFGGWDIASGCIWDKSAIKSSTHMAPGEVERYVDDASYGVRYHMRTTAEVAKEKADIFRVEQIRQAAKEGNATAIADLTQELAPEEAKRLINMPD